MNIAIYQMDLIPGNPKENHKRVEQWLELIGQESDLPDVLVLPEMWTTAYTLEKLERIAEDDKRETEAFLSRLAASYQVNIIAGSVATKEESAIYNRALVFNRSGELIYHYDKIHLVPMLKEDLYLTGGTKPVAVFELDGYKAGLIICYDLRFPELARSLALAGAEVLFIVAEWPEARATHWKILQQARAIENQLFVVSANRVGTYDDVTFAGGTMVINPWGDIISEGSSDQVETVKANIDLQETQQIRQHVPVFSSRIPRLYR